jgi:hypothetical protein
MAELLVAICIFCGVLMMLLVALNRAGEIAALNVERTHAACRLSQVLDEIRLGVRKDSVTVIVPPAGEGSLRGERCVVRVAPWPEDATLQQVTVTVEWQSERGRRSSLSASTLVSGKRMKSKETAP